jgi:hypothetical protein
MLRCVLAVCLFLAAASAQLAAPAQSAGDHGYRPFLTALEDDYFDGTTAVEFQRATRHMRAARQLGAKYFRCAFSWNGIEPEPGKYRWKFWDHLVNEAEKNGITLIPYVGYTPEWAARSRENFWRQPPIAPALYAEFMRVIATRYKGRIKHWEIWNEPDLEEYWTGTPDEFAELVRQAANAIRAVDPSVRIVLGGMSRGPAEFYRVLHDQHRIEQYVDIVAIHAYPESWDEERAESVYYDRVETMAKLIAPYKRELWLNETGYPDYRYRRNQASIYGVNAFYRYEHTPQYQAAFLFKTFAMALGFGKASLIGWYRTDDFPHSDTRLPNDKVHNHLGLLDTRGRPKPAMLAFAFFNRLFGQPTRSARVTVASSVGKSSQAMVEAIERKDGTLVVVAWLRSSEDHEVHDRGGMATDRRRETLAITLPCTETRGLRAYTPTGAPLTSNVRVQGRNRLSNVPARGDTVFVATMLCVRD